MKREEIENELKRYKEEVEDIHMRNMLEAKFGVGKLLINNQPEYEHSAADKTESTCYLDAHGEVKDQEFGNIYGKLSSDLMNLRSEINNLKSERTNIDTSRNDKVLRNITSKTSLDNYRHKDSDFYYKMCSKPQRVIGKRPLETESKRNNNKLAAYDSNFSGIEKLNQLESKLNQKNAFDTALDHDSESDGMLQL